MDIIDIIKSNYLINVKEVEKNQDSTDGNVYIIKADKKYVLKIYDDEEHVNSMTLLHTFLTSNKFNVPYIVKTKNNCNYLEYNNKFYVVYTFLEGMQLSNFKPIPNNIIENFAKELRKFHDITASNDFNLNKVTFCDYNDMRLSVLHFDLTKANIFSNNDKIGFIDFDDAKYGPSVIDVAISIALLFISKSSGIDKTGIEIFLNSYYGENIKLKEKEAKLIKEYAIDWINYVTSGHEFDSSTKESFELKKVLLEENSSIFNE